MELSSTEKDGGSQELFMSFRDVHKPSIVGTVYDDTKERALTSDR